MNIRTALDNGLTLAVDGEMAIVTIIRSKLTHNPYNNQVAAASGENATLTGCRKDKAVLTVIDVDVGGDIEDKVGTVFTSIDIKLLTFDGIDGLDLELVLLLFEVIVLWVESFLFCLGGQDVVLRLGWFLHRRLHFWLHFRLRGLLLDFVFAFDEFLLVLLPTLLFLFRLQLLSIKCLR